MNILITGCAGFIGSHLTEALLKNGEKIIGFDNFDDYYPRVIKEGNIKSFVDNSNFTLIEGDIRDRELIVDVLRQHKIEAIVHLAARAGVRPSIDNPILYSDVNVNGTTILLESAQKLNIKKFVFASSSSVYGNNSKVPFSETDKVDFPISPYAATKRAGELICYTFSNLYSMDISCLRFFTVYGPRQRPEMAISKFIKQIKEGKTIEVYANGQSSRDYTYIDDIVNGIILALGQLDGYNIYNIGGSSPIKLIELIRIIEKTLTRKADLKFLSTQAGDVDITYADAKLAYQKLNYKSKISIEEGIRKYINYNDNFNVL